MTDKLTSFKRADGPLPEKNRVWPLYGAGFDKLGLDGQPIDTPMPQPGPDELLVRHDACGLCFSDIKIINLGQEHPRIRRNMAENPVVLGHEVAMTVVGVGENLRGQYHVGDRFTIQADIWLDGVGYAYGYEIQGGLSLYNVIDQRVLNGDDGNYLIPVQPDTGYAEAALTEPWACVTAAYQLTYRTGIKPGGVAWIIGSHASDQHEYRLSAGFDRTSHPWRLLLTDVPDYFDSWLRKQAEALGVEVLDVADPANPPVEQVDDIILLGATPELIETVSPRLADFGIVALIADQPLARKVNVDIGRIHYNRWVYVGGQGPEIAEAYSDVPVRSTLKPGGRALFVGAGGPMGRMHVQRALQAPDGPAVIVCTDVSDVRLNDLEESYRQEAEAQGIEFICLNPMNKAAYQAGMARFTPHPASPQGERGQTPPPSEGGGWEGGENGFDDWEIPNVKANHVERGGWEGGENGFDDIIVMAPVPAVIAEAASWLAPEGVMNIFAGVARGVKAALDLSDVYLKDVRVIGHSASSIDDLRLMLQMAESGRLSPNRSVAAIGSLSAAKDGMEALRDTIFPGKVVIYPHIKEMPLTAVPDLKESLPSVYALLKNGREWTNEAEAEFLRLMLA